MKDLTDLFISAYPEMWRATFVLQRAGISRAALNENQPVAKYWQEALAFVDAIGRLPRLAEVALGDNSIAAFHSRLRAAHDAYQAAQQKTLDGFGTRIYAARVSKEPAMNRKIAFVPRRGYFAMPATYDPAKVTRDDIARDAAICQATAELTVLRRESKALSDRARDAVSDASEDDLSALDAIDEHWADAIAALARDDLAEARAYLTLAQTYAARWGSSMHEDKALAMLPEVA